jgi:tetratricopeptide (TPR) repeat protein
VERRSGERAVEYEEIVGYHAERAHAYLAELGPVDERGAALAALAAERLASAGVRSFDRGDMPSAASLLSRAVALMPALDPRRLELMQSLAVSLANMGRLDDADAVFKQAIEGGRAIGDRRIELRAAVRYKFTWMLRAPEATHADAIAEMERSIAAFEELDDDAGLAEALQATRCCYGSARSNTPAGQATAGWRSTCTTGWAWPWARARRRSAKRSTGSRGCFAATRMTRCFGAT